jgi:hypothetical protein
MGLKQQTGRLPHRSRAKVVSSQLPARGRFVSQCALERGHSCPPPPRDILNRPCATVCIGVGFGVDQRARSDVDVRAPITPTSQVLHAFSSGTRFMAVSAGAVLTARKKRFVTLVTMRSPGLLLAASQHEGQHT